MKLLMASGDRQVPVGERGPFHALLREFAGHFERIDVLSPRPDRPPTVREPFENVHLHPASCGRLAMASYVARRGAELVAEHRHELIVSHDYGWFYNGLGSARLSRASGVPYVSELHHVPGHPIAATAGERVEKLAAHAYVRWATSRVRAFRVVNSIEMPELLASWGVPRDKIAVLPSLYVDFSVFRPREPRPEPQQDVLFVGRMVANKGLDRIVDALAELSLRGRKLEALFVGKGPLRRSTEVRAASRGLAPRTRFVEWVASPGELAEIYRRSRVVVCASTCEGGPRFTVEAMACGTPVVSTPVGMMKELLADGVNGATCGFDAASLATAIERVLSDEPRRAAMGERACADVQRFEYATVIRRYADGLKRLAGARA